MRFLLAISRAYPWRTAMTLLAMILAGLMEGIGLSLLPPMLSVAMGEPSQAGTDGLSGFSGTLLAMLIGLGIAPTLGSLVIGACGGDVTPVCCRGMMLWQEASSPWDKPRTQEAL